jgi:hypothetical protein
MNKNTDATPEINGRPGWDGRKHSATLSGVSAGVSSSVGELFNWVAVVEGFWDFHRDVGVVSPQFIHLR